jgi:hypothetical protein
MEVGKKKITITKAKMHPLISKDLFVAGNKKKNKMKIPEV